MWYNRFDDLSPFAAARVTPPGIAGPLGALGVAGLIDQFGPTGADR